MPDARVHADPRGGGRHVGLTDALGDLDVIQKNAIAQRRRQQPDARPGRQPAQFFPIIEVAVGLNRLEREGAVHGAGLEVQQPEAGGDARRYRALAGAGRAVDGHHQRRTLILCHAPGFFLAGLRPRKLAGGLPGFSARFSALPSAWFSAGCRMRPARGHDFAGREPGTKGGRTALSSRPGLGFAPDLALPAGRGRL